MRNCPLVPAVDGRTRASQVNRSVLAFRKSARLGYINWGVQALRIRRRLGHREGSRSEQHNPGSHVTSDHVHLALLRSGEFDAWWRLRAREPRHRKGGDGPNRCHSPTLRRSEGAEGGGDHVHPRVVAEPRNLSPRRTSHVENASPKGGYRHSQFQWRH
jgi:hypothetical protein